MFPFSLEISETNRRNLDNGLLIDMFAEKGHAEGTEQEPGFLVVGRRGADQDGDARNHFGWVSV